MTIGDQRDIRFLCDQRMPMRDGVHNRTHSSHILLPVTPADRGSQEKQS